MTRDEFMQIVMSAVPDAGDPVARCLRREAASIFDPLVDGVEQMRAAVQALQQRAHAMFAAAEALRNKLREIEQLNRPATP